MNNKYRALVICVVIILGVVVEHQPLHGEEMLSVVISEIGAYEKSGQEWIEVVNVTGTSIDIGGWSFWENKTNHKISLIHGEDSILESGEYAVITQNNDTFESVYPLEQTTLFDSAWSTLNEKGEEIGLKDDTGEFVEVFTYIPAPDTSLERSDIFWTDYTTENWHQHESGNSVGKINSTQIPIEKTIEENTEQVIQEEVVETPTQIPILEDKVEEKQEVQVIIKEVKIKEKIFINTPPEINVEYKGEVEIKEALTFDASQTIDFDGDAMLYHWYIEKKRIGEGNKLTYSFETEGLYTVELKVTDKHFGISKAYVDIRVKDIKKEIIVKEEVQIEEKDEKIEEVHISEFIPNPIGKDDSEFIEIYNPTDEEIDISYLQLDDADGGSFPYSVKEGTILGIREYLVFYQKETGIALNNTSDKVRLLDKKGNILKEVSYHDVAEGVSHIWWNEEWTSTETPTPGEKNSLKVALVSKEKELVIKTKEKQGVIDDIKKEKKGTFVKTNGIVTVLPGVLSAQYFYIQDDSGALQVYMHAKDFPEISLGDIINVKGELSEIQTEKRIKTKIKEDIQIVESGNYQAPEDINDILLDKEYSGKLVRLEGEVIETQSSFIYVASGKAEIAVSLKRHKNVKVSKGDKIEVIGIVQKYKDDFQIVPRVVEDIVIKENKKQTSTSTSTVPGLKGTKQQESKYTKPVIVLILIIGAGWYIKKKYKDKI
ncbi:MAG: hypothetical protein HOD12_01115 [Candidatus Magasanikbacteria bacterium]|nr:hypothetical protein [Candidatus Magasanikbacteria bacterium]